MPKVRRASQQRRGIGPDSPYFSEFNQFVRRVRQKIARLRQDKGFTQEQLEDYGIGVRQFQRIESGESGNLTLANIFRISKAFGLKPSELIDV